MATARHATQVAAWYVGLHLPRSVLGTVIHRPARVDAYNEAPGSDFVPLLRSVNTFRSTGWCRVMTKHGSDKGRRWHNYTTVYAALFAGRQDRPLRIFELGLGTNNPHLVSTMGAAGRPGASLRGWRELFPRATVYGADIDRTILFTDDRIKTFYCDQLDAAAIHDLWAQPDLAAGMDILVEDGLHTLEANQSFLEHSLEHVVPGGTYVIEDIESSRLEAWRGLLPNTYAKRFPNFEFALLSLPNAYNSFDNNMLIVRRRV